MKYCDNATSTTATAHPNGKRNPCAELRVGRQAETLPTRGSSGGKAPCLMGMRGKYLFLALLLFGKKKVASCS